METLISGFLQGYCRVSRALAANAHRLAMEWEWGKPPEWKSKRRPEFFNHHQDLFYAWLHSRNSLSWERGVFSGLCLQGGRVLDLCCGDGFYARNFYSLRSREVVACDIAPQAIAYARRHNAGPNIFYQLCDIRRDFPGGSFENIVWDAAIEHFTLPEIRSILPRIKAALTPQGILSGYTVVEKTDGKQHPEHEHEFRCKEDLLSLFRPLFRIAVVFETRFPERHNLYFWASDASLPFQPGSSHSLWSMKMAENSPS